MITTSMVGGSGSETRHVRGMMPAAMQAILDTAAEALETRLDLMEALEDIRALAELELNVEEEIESVGGPAWELARE